jgi:hypothetical protein
MHQCLSRAGSFDVPAFFYSIASQIWHITMAACVIGVSRFDAVLHYEIVISKLEMKEYLSLAAMLAYACAMWQQKQHVKMHTGQVHASMDNGLLIRGVD